MRFVEGLCRSKRKALSACGIRSPPRIHVSTDGSGVVGHAGARMLASLRTARAPAREVAWLQAADRGEGVPAVRAAGREVPGLVLDLDATLVTCHS